MADTCAVGSTLYKGICVPTYYTPDERERAYQEKLITSAKKKKSDKMAYVLLGVALTVGAVLFGLNLLG